jgi:hypothetical protein
MNQKSLPKAVQDSQTLISWLIPLLDAFPRNRRFTLGERLESLMLNILALKMEAAYCLKTISSNCDQQGG